MHRSTFSLEELDKLHDVSTPYIYNDKKGRYEKQNWPTLGNYEVGGGIRSNVLDLLKYGELYLNSSNAIISAEQSKKMLQPYLSINRKSYYGYAFEITPYYHGVTLIEHGGGQPGVSSNFGFIPEQNLVAAVLTNVSDVATRDIWLESVNTALGIPLEKKRSIEPIANFTIEQKERFIGNFQSEEGTSLQILLKNDDLYAMINDKEYLLRASDENTLVLIANEKPIRFYYDNKGVIWSAFFGLRMLLKTA